MNDLRTKTLRTIEGDQYQFALEILVPNTKETNMLPTDTRSLKEAHTCTMCFESFPTLALLRGHQILQRNGLYYCPYLLPTLKEQWNDEMSDTYWDVDGE